jgi:mRNA interferase YafQ
MQFDVQYTKRFRKDVRRLERSHYKLQRLHDVVVLLKNGEQLPEQYRNHKLSAEYEGYEECHIQSDWLLIYKRERGLLVLVLTRTGTHAELFGM